MARLTFRAYVPEGPQQQAKSRRSTQASLLAVVTLAALVLASGISVTPRTITFFPTTVGSTEIQHVDIANRGPGLMRIETTRFEGRDASVFRSDSQLCSSIESGDVCEFDISYRPTSTGPHVATFWLTDNNGLKHRVELSASAHPGLIEVAPELLQFGDVQTGGTKMLQSRLSAAANFQISSLQLKGTDPEDFHVDGGNCTTQPVPGSRFCLISVRFEPTGLGVSHALVSFTDKMSGQLHSVELIGNGVAPASVGVPGISGGEIVKPPPGVPRIAIDPPALDFTQPNNTRQSVVVSNSGSAPLHVDVSMGGDNANRFEADASECSARPVQASSQCIVTVKYKPKIFGQANVARAELIITHDVKTIKNPLVVALNWTREATTAAKLHVKVTPEQITFATSTRSAMMMNAPAATYAPQQVIIRNETDSPPLTQLSLRLGFVNQDASGPFGYTTNCHEHLNTGEECTVSVNFVPKNPRDLKKTSKLYAFEGTVNAVASVPLNAVLNSAIQ